MKDTNEPTCVGPVLTVEVEDEVGGVDEVPAVEEADVDEDDVDVSLAGRSMKVSIKLWNARCQNKLYSPRTPSTATFTTSPHHNTRDNPQYQNQERQQPSNNPRPIPPTPRPPGLRVHDRRATRIGYVGLDETWRRPCDRHAREGVYCRAASAFVLAGQGLVILVHHLGRVFRGVHELW